MSSTASLTTRATDSAFDSAADSGSAQQRVRRASHPIAFHKFIESYGVDGEVRLEVSQDSARVVEDHIGQVKSHRDVRVIRETELDGTGNAADTQLQ